VVKSVLVIASGKYAIRLSRKHQSSKTRKHKTAGFSWFDRFRSLIIVIWELHALLNRLVRICEVNGQCNLHNEDGHAISVLFNR